MGTKKKTSVKARRRPERGEISPIVSDKPAYTAGAARLSPIREAFWMRASAALKDLTESADEHVLQQAVQAPTDAGALARAISGSSILTTAAVTALDPLAALIARGADQKAELLKQAGGAVPVSAVAQLLGISRQGVDKRRREGKLLAVPRGDDFAYPTCQFDDDQVLKGLPEVLEARGVHQPWATLAFLMTPDDQLRDRSPIEVLRRGDLQLTPLVIRLARAAAGDGFG